MSQQRLELNHLASTSRLPSSPLQGRASGKSRRWGFNRHRGSAGVVFPLEVWLLILENLVLRDLYSLTVTSKFFYNNFISIYLNRHPGSASVVFPVEIWMLILGNLALRDLYSLTITSKFFYNNFISLYRNRVAHEGIPRRKRPDSVTQARTRTIWFFVLIYTTSLIEAILAGILIAKSPDLSNRACFIYIVSACCCTFKLVYPFLSSSRFIYDLWVLWFWLWIAGIIFGHVVLANNDCNSNPIESRKTATLYCRLWRPVLAFVWVEWALAIGVLFLGLSC